MLEGVIEGTFRYLLGLGKSVLPDFPMGTSARTLIYIDPAYIDVHSANLVHLVVTSQCFFVQLNKYFPSSIVNRR